jgi:hypothetical protein
VLFGEIIEIFSVEPAQVDVIGDQPKKTILSLFDVIHNRARQTLISGEMSTEEAAGWLVWVKRVDRSTQHQNPETSEQQTSSFLCIVHDG